MLALALMSLLTLSSDSTGLVGEPVEIASDAPAIRIWLNNNRQFREGERARVQVEARDDGYLVVLNYDPSGRLRVLFPVEPGDDNFVRGGRRYEIQGRGDRESFIAERDGDGVVFAAVAADPFRFDEYEAGSNWDYARLAIDRDSPDPEADISDLLQRISSDRGFDYDVLSYRVYQYRGYPAYAWYPSYYDDFYCNWWTRPSLFGCRYWPGSGWYFGYNSWYSPYSYGYYPYNYGYYYPYGGWYPGRIVYGGNRRWPVVVGRPRGYTIGHRTFGGSVSRPTGGSFSGSLPGGRTPVNSGRARPPSDRPTARPSDGDRGRPSGSRPRARPVKPSTSPPPNVERERGSGQSRGPVQTDRPRARPARPDRPDNQTPSVDRYQIDRGRPVEIDRARGSDRETSRSAPGSSRDVRIYSIPGRARPVESGSASRPSGESSRPSEPRYEAPARRSSGAERSRGYTPPRAESSPRSYSPPRESPRSYSPPRASAPPRSSPPPRVSSPPRASSPSSSRPSGGSRPRGRPGRP